MLKDIPDLPPEKEYHVFVCYNSGDINEVHILVDELEKYGIICCYCERDFKPGCNVLKNTHQCMEKSLCTLIVLSENSVKSKFCMYEIEEAVHMRVERGYYLIPVQIEPCVVPECIRNVTCIDASEDVIAAVPRKILRAITENEIFAEHSRVINGECVTFNVRSTESGSRFTKWLSYPRFNLKIRDWERKYLIFDNNFQISSDLLDDVENIVNSSLTVRYRHVLVNMKKTITFVFLLVLLTLFCVYSIAVLATMRSTMDPDRMLISLKVLLFGLPVLLVIWLVTLCISCCCFEGLFDKALKSDQSNVTKVLWRRINKKHARENKAIIYFPVHSMKLKIMRYNFKTCQDYFSWRCERYTDLQRIRFHDEGVKAYTDRIFDTYLSANVGQLFVSEPFAIPHERRHNMANKAICLCKQVENWL